MKDTGGSAFPVPPIAVYENGSMSYAEEGMTLRDYAELKAMQGILAGWDNPESSFNPGAVVKRAKLVADEWMKARTE